MAFIPIHDANPLRHIRRPWVAWTMMAVNVFVFFVVQQGAWEGPNYEASVFSYGLIPAVINGALDPLRGDLPPWATLLTYAFLHGDIWHLAGNMIFLWVFADNVEDALGHFRYLVFYLLSAAAAGYAFVLSDPASHAPVIGASGAVAANIGAYLLLHPRAKIWILVFFRIPVRVRAYWVIGFWIVFQFISVASDSGDGEHIAWWAHIGGVIAGALLILVMRRPGVPLFAPDPGVPAPAPPAAPPPVARAEPPPRDPTGPWG